MDDQIKRAAKRIATALGLLMPMPYPVGQGKETNSQAAAHYLSLALGDLLDAPDLATEVETGGMLAEVANKASQETKGAALDFLSRLPAKQGEDLSGHSFEKAIHAMTEEAIRLSGGYEPGNHYPDERGVQYHQLPPEGRKFYHNLAMSMVGYLKEGIREEV